MSCATIVVQLLALAKNRATKHKTIWQQEC